MVAMVRHSPREQQAAFGDRLGLTSRPALGADQQASRPDVILNHRAADTKTSGTVVFCNTAKAVCISSVLSFQQTQRVDCALIAAAIAAAIAAVFVGRERSKASWP